MEAASAWELAADLIAPPETDWEWLKHARPSQLPPPGDWFVWLIMAGRGFGKTRTGAEWIARQAQITPGGHFAVVARSTQDCREVCIEGPSGLLKVLGLTRDSDDYNRTTGEIRLPNGAVIHSYGAEKPDRLRGPNLSGAWCDELASWRYVETWTEGLIPALRIGKPHVVVTTTPRPAGLIRDLAKRDDGSVFITRGSTFENSANLSATALEELRRRYEGTRLGRQELEGELIDDIEGALWTRAMIEASRVREDDVPEMTRIVVAVDPAATATAESDDTGIIVAGVGTDGDAYILDDRTCHLPPEGWAQRVVRAYHHFEADRVVAEANQGGEMVSAVLLTADRKVPVKLVRASRGKQTRAEPVAALFGAPPKRESRVHLVGGFPELEDQLCSWVPGDANSPDRLDACTWAITELMLKKQGSWRPL